MSQYDAMRHLPHTHLYRCDEKLAVELDALGPGIYRESLSVPFALAVEALEDLVKMLGVRIGREGMPSRPMVSGF